MDPHDHRDQALISAYLKLLEGPASHTIARMVWLVLFLLKIFQRPWFYNFNGGAIGAGVDSKIIHSVVQGGHWT